MEEKIYGGKTLEERKNDFIEKAKKVHEGQDLDFSKVVYTNNRTKVCIIDHSISTNGEEYGEFWITPSNLLKGKSHPKRKSEKTIKDHTLDFEELKERFRKAHPGEDLDYSKSVYKTMHTKILIIDHDKDPFGNEYGEFWQEPNVHVKGCGHPRKAIDRNGQKQRLTTESFTERAKSIHGDRYDYSKVDYVAYRTPVEIICKKHGSFLQKPETHLEKKGCPKCGNHYSAYEDEIIKFINGRCGMMTEKGNKSILDGKEIDIYVPSRKIGIEFDGLRWHTEFFAGKDRHYHLDKTLAADRKGVTLIHIFEDEYVNAKEIVLSKIARILGSGCMVERKIDGRKCTVSEISKREAFDFLKSNHLQGGTASTVYLGAFFSGELVAVMTFKNEKDGKWNLSRFASDIRSSCRGVGGKMFSFFIRNYDAVEVKSFLDRRYCSGGEENIYIRIGFVVDSDEKPDYCYYNENIDRFHRFHKFGFRKSILSRRYGFDTSMTELEMARRLGYDRIWNCGLIKYVWRKN